MRLGRRALLQRTGLALAAFGVSEASFLSWADLYHQVLAQPTRRKLALLVGIDQYPEQVCDFASGQGIALQGCVTDVELQRELLTYRFGFQPADILTLTNQQATRQKITEAFQTHLADQARVGDVVVFHFSGYGSQIRLDSQPEMLRKSLVPIDGFLPTEDNPIISDLLEDTLGLLLKSLKTHQVTTVLDLGHADLGKMLWGNLRVRSRPNIPTGQLSPRELALQTILRTRTKAVTIGVGKQQSTHLPGIVLAAATPAGIAVEGQWQGFSAGVFTYALTQRLWWATPATTLRIALARTTETMQQWAGLNHQPQLRGQRREDASLSIYDTALRTDTTADGVVAAIAEDGKTLQLWLGGLPGQVLKHFGANSRLTLVEETAAPPTHDLSSKKAASTTRTLQLRARNGLTAQARLELSDGWLPRIGQPVYESIRNLPHNIDLIVALDTSLERIERVDATSALSGISFVSYTTAGEQSADCLLGKVRETGAQTLTASLPADVETLEGGTLSSPKVEVASSNKGYGLFSPGRKLIPGSLANEDEAIKTAVNRLNPQLQTLLAAKLLRLTQNQGSSRLAVRASLEMVAPEEGVLLQQQTERSLNPMPEFPLATLIADSGQTAQLSAGSRIRFRLSNFSDRLLYLALIGFDSGGRAVAFYPDFPTEGQSNELSKTLPEGNMIQPGEEIIVPQAAADWMVGSTSRWLETHLVFSVAPLSRTVDALLHMPNAAANTQRISAAPKPLHIAQAVLADLNRASATLTKENNLSLDAYALDVEAWATLSFVYQVV